MHIDNLVQYDEYKMPKDSHFEDNQEQNDDVDYEWKLWKLSKCKL